MISEWICFIFLYFIPALKMARDSSRESRHVRWCYYFAGIAALTFIYIIFSMKLSIAASFLLGLVLSFNDGAIVCVLGKYVIAPCWLSLRTVLEPFLNGFLGFLVGFCKFFFRILIEVKKHVSGKKINTATAARPNTRRTKREANVKDL